MMPKMAKMALVGTEVGGTTPSPGRQSGFVLSFCRFCSVSTAEVRGESKDGMDEAERTARSLISLLERFAMERSEVRKAEMVSGTGAMMTVALNAWYVRRDVE